jgi:peptidyl-prolyl cis-trans isomerase C
MTISWLSHARALALAASVFLPVTAAAGSDSTAVLANAGPDVVLTVADVEQEATRYSPETVKNTFSRPELVVQIGRNLLLRRIVAREAEKSALGRQPAMATRLQLARERVLSDAYIQQFDGDPPDAATLEKLARADYNGNPERYRVSAADHIEHLMIGVYRKDAGPLAAELYGQIKNGASFGSLALMYSDDAGTKAKQGDMGFVEKGKLRPEFDRVIAALAKPGDVSEPFETDLGWHMLRLVERRQAGREPFEKVKEELMQAAARGVVDKRRSARLDPLEQTIQVDEKVVEEIVGRYRTPRNR